MATFAVIKDGVVENCIISESLETAEEVTGLTCIEYQAEDIVSIGFTYADGVFTNPNAPEETVQGEE